MAQTLEEYRIECGFSQSELARRAGIDFNTLRRALEGETVSATTARKIARAISQELGREVRYNDISGLKVRL